MKKLLHIIVLLSILIIFPNKTYAQSNMVEVQLNGDIKKNNTIEILINFNDVKNLYAASIDYEYDNKLVKILEIEPSSFIKNDKVKIMEFGESINKDGKKASYYFTCLGNEKGISGTGNFVTIKAKILEEGSLALNSDNMVLKLATKNNDNTIEELKYTLNVTQNSSTVKPDSQDNTDINKEVSNDKENLEEYNEIESNVLSKEESNLMVENNSESSKETELKHEETKQTELKHEDIKEIEENNKIKESINISTDNNYIYIVLILLTLALVYLLLKKWKQNK